MLPHKSSQCMYTAIIDFNDRSQARLYECPYRPQHSHDEVEKRTSSKSLWLLINGKCSECRSHFSLLHYLVHSLGNANCFLIIIYTKYSSAASPAARKKKERNDIESRSPARWRDNGAHSFCVVKASIWRFSVVIKRHTHQAPNSRQCRIVVRWNSLRRIIDDWQFMWIFTAFSPSSSSTLLFYSFLFGYCLSSLFLLNKAILWPH